MEAANSKMFHHSEDIAFNSLEVCNYRHLQGLAKQMGLPSNVKKVELIEMIRAKRYCSEKDLETIINRVKMERKANAQLKRNQKKKSLRLQGTEVSSTSQSPSITLTPTRPHSEFVIPLDIMKSNPRPSVVEAGNPYMQKLKSDRVLRSFHSMRRPNYRILDQTDCIVGVVKSRNTIREIRHQERIQQFQEIRHKERVQQFQELRQKERVQQFQEIRQKERVQQYQEIHHERAFQSVNVNLQTQRPVNALVRKGDRQLVPVITRTLKPSSNPAKRERKLSGIYPLESQENPPYEYMPTVNFRQTDGRICKINAIIQRPLANTLLPKNHTFHQKRSLIRRDSTAKVPDPRVTIQDVINYEVDHPTVDLTCARDIDKVHEIDLSNGINRPSYEQRNVNQQIKPKKRSREIEQPMQDYQSSSIQYEQDDANAVKLTYQGRTLVNIIPEQLTDRDQNRKVYTNRQTTSHARKSLNFEIGQEPKERKPKSKKNINNQSLNTANGSRKAKEYRNQVPAVPKIISSPMSRETRYDQETRDRNMEHARNMEYARNADHARNNEYARNADHSRDMDCTRNAELTEYVYSRHMDYARNRDVKSCSELARIGQARNVNPNKEHARNKDLRAIETDKTVTDVRNQYPNMPSLTDVMPNGDYTQHAAQSQFSVFNHKHINAEQMTGSTVERLPRINEVFSQFNEVAHKKLSQPLFVKVTEESTRAPIPMTININNACLLESIYNFKSQFLTNPPLRRIKPPNTNCTFSTYTVPTAVEQSSAAQNNTQYNRYERASAYQLYNEGYQSRYEYARPEVQLDVGCDEDMISPTATVDTQESPASPEMVEDALELISQDGDYMERIGMDVRVQCILSCVWAGPRFIMEYHLKNEHPQEIHHISSPTSRVQISLSRSLGDHAWSSQLLQYRDTLYALSAQRNENSLLLAFSAIPNDLDIPRRCRITVCNERLKQPIFYECEIKHVPDSMPYEYGRECLALDLASLDLIPSSDNTKLVNSLVGNPGGQDLDSVELAVYIQLFD